MTGASALTGYDPPSALLSPANAEAIGFLETVATELVAIAVEAGLQPQVQIGEPWWWVTPSGAICLYDDAARAALGGDPVEIADVRASLTRRSSNCSTTRARCLRSRRPQSPRRSSCFGGGDDLAAGLLADGARPGCAGAEAREPAGRVGDAGVRCAADVKIMSG